MAEEQPLLQQFAALKLDNQNVRDEMRSVKADARSKEDTIRDLEQQIQSLKTDLKSKDDILRALEQKVPLEVQAAKIGKDVRMRYLEEHRRRMGSKNIQHGRFKAGNHAAHRGRALVDALLYQSGERHDVNIYADLYGVEPKFVLQFQDIHEIITVCGFHGTLKSDGQMQSKFEDTFKGLVDYVKKADNAEKVKAEFKGSSLLSRKHQALEACFDEIIAADSPRYRGRPAKEAEKGMED
ncbi:hypothetical protein DM02DRAFT_259815 [Periconia macrospinosa]|uniref:Uncharacterized protein n=1 Tax=Periconia macrospinosa TaxID=97972 RepID=A0A2V1D4B9_9PLEO|nr:hypothetical protein DM02DRAFT_259815 [Periconia macrospinosa]